MRLSIQLWPTCVKAHPSGLNQVIVNTLDQQMLLNLVRLKYRDSTMFLNINSVTASFSMGADIGVDAELLWDFDQDGVRLGDGRLVSPNVGMSYSQSPTISYTPLQGEDYTKSILGRLPISYVLLQGQSGWRTERVFGIFVERVNDLYNAPEASGPTPEDEPQYKKFKRLLELMGQLDDAGLTELGTGLDKNKTKRLIFLIEADPNYQSVIEELKSLLDISQQQNRFILDTNFVERGDNELDIATRSISSAMYYLSQNVDIPESHIEDGLVTITKTTDGKEFNWDDTPAGVMFKVRSKKGGKPDNAFLSVPYRGAWFYIADNDLNSKSTFRVLKGLFSLQAGQIIDAGPTLTLPVGGG